jgi:tight adherence protein B
MDGMMLPFLIAACVGLVAWWVMSLFGGGEKRRLSARLSGEGTETASSAQQGGSVVLTSTSENIPEFLRERPWAQRLQARLSQAYPDASLRNFLSLALGCAAGGFLIAVLVSGGKLLIGLGVGAAIGYLPFFFMTLRRRKRQQIINMQLPEALDFLSRVMRAGHSLSTGLQMMADELPKPLSDEFRRAYDQHSLGQSLEDALKGAASRVDSTDFAFFVTSVLIQRQTGGDLSEVLNNISGMIRSRIHLQQHVKAKTAEGRFTGYIMVAFPAVMFAICYFLNPDYCGVLLHTSMGLKLLGVAFGLQMSGLWMIKKITTVRV